MSLKLNTTVDRVELESVRIEILTIKLINYKSNTKATN